MATDTLELDGDVTTDWDTTVPSTPTTHYTKIDEGTATPSDADYNETTTLDDVDEFTFNATAANHNETSQIDLKVRLGITDASNNAYVRCELFHSAGTPVTGNPKDIACSDTPGADEVANDGTLKTVTKSWTGLALNKTQMDSLQVRFTFKSA